MTNSIERIIFVLVKILYVIPIHSIGKNDGGSTHILEVSKGLAKLGWEVHTVVKKQKNLKPQTSNIKYQVSSLSFHEVYLPLNYLSLLTFPHIYKLALSIKPDLIIERYYNFSGVGILTAKILKIPSILEVNTPLIEYKCSPKSIIDSLLIFKPMKYWREKISNWSSKIITPLKTIIPPNISEDKIEEINWGANVEMFNKSSADKVIDIKNKLNIPLNSKVVVFSGSFRKWHGLMDFVKSACIVLKKSPSFPLNKERIQERIHFLMIGDGEMYNEILSFIQKNKLEKYFTLTGKIKYESVPEYLSIADIAIAPFNTSSHKYLELGFYWSPLKIFEYMAMQLPVITININPLNKIIRDGEEGLLYEEGNVQDLSNKIEILLKDESLAKKLGENARKRVVENYSWEIHCERLNKIMQKLL